MLARCRARVAKRLQRGSGFVEVLVVSPLLLLLVFGGIEFGTGWNQKIEMNQAVRAAARQGTTGQYQDAGCASEPVTGARVACAVRNAVEFPVAVRVEADIKGKDPLPGDELTVCASKALSGSTPIAGQIVEGIPLRSEVTMVVEKVFANDLSGFSGDSDPSGDGWSWCG